MGAIKMTCPAARDFHPAAGDLPGVVCGVLRNANRGEAIDGWSERGQVSEIMHPREDPATIRSLCAGTAVVGPRPVDARPLAGEDTTQSYPDCPVWRAELERIEAGRPEQGGLHAEQHRPPPSPGRTAALEALMSGRRHRVAERAAA